jgi:hypothetical protein
MLAAAKGSVIFNTKTILSESLTFYLTGRFILLAVDSTGGDG